MDLFVEDDNERKSLNESHAGIYLKYRGGLVDQFTNSFREDSEFVAYEFLINDKLSFMTGIANGYAQKITGNAPQDTVDPDASGKAINVLRARENLSTQTMTDNIQQAIKHSGLAYLSIAKEIYTDRRQKRTLAVDGTTNVVPINNEVLYPDQARLVTGNKVAAGKFKVDVEVGPQYESQREATVETLERAMQLVGEQSKYFEPLIAMWLKNISGTGLDVVKEFNRREMLKMGLSEPETEEEEQMLEQLRAAVDPNDELIKAAKDQQQAEALNLVESAKNKAADTEKKKAETQEIISNIKGSFVERRLQQLGIRQAA